jgi:hypothetical protein
MSDLGSSNFSETDASNSASPPAGFPEGMFPSDVNNSARAVMGGLKRFWNRTNSVKTTGGTTSALTLTYDVAAASLYDGEEFSFVLGTTPIANATLNINGLGAKSLRKFTSGAFAVLAGGELVSGQVVRVRYNLSATTFDIIGVAFIPSDYVTAGGNIAFTGNNTHSGTEGFSGTVTMTGKAINQAQGADIASATTTDIGAATGNYVKVTGTTTITGLGTVQAGTQRIVEFTGALTLTHNATSLILPGAANITTAAGDVAGFVSEGSGNWRCAFYQRASGAPVGAANLAPITQSLGANVALNNTGSFFDGPTVAQGSTGTWFASGTVTMYDTSGSATFDVKLWDGTTVIASTRVFSSFANTAMTASLSGQLASPAGNLRISVKDLTSTNGLILNGIAGNNSSTITAIRVA